MTKHLTLLLILSVGFSQQEYNIDDLIEMDNGLWTVKFSDEPVTGKVFGYFGEPNNPKKVYIGNLRNGKKEGKMVSYYHSTGKKSFECNYKDGELDGLKTNWYENGQREQEATFKDGELDGLITDWYENGQKKSKKSYKDGKKDGLWIEWHENGQKGFEGNFKDGKREELQTQWYENGQKMGVGSFKNGKLHGLETRWYENGQKWMEVAYKDGKVILGIEWNRDGSIKETLIEKK